MRMGTGLQNKLLEAMSMQLPCITSPLAAKPLVEAEQHQAVASCGHTSEFVEEIERLLTNENHYQQLAEAGYHYVHQFYDWQSAVQKLEDLLKS